MDHERGLVTFFIANEWNFKVFIEICNYLESFLYFLSYFSFSFRISFLVLLYNRPRNLEQGEKKRGGGKHFWLIHENIGL